MSPDEQNARLLDWLQGSEHRAPSNSLRSSRNRLSTTEEQSPEPSEASDAAISLKDVLRNDPWNHNEIPEAIHLPDSHASSSTVNANLSGLNMTNDSLEAILHSDGPVIPSMVPLLGPMLSSASSQQAEDVFVGTGRTGRPHTRKKKRTTRLTYDKIIENAGRSLDHIKDGNVGKDSRHNRASVIYYDYTDSSRSSAVHIKSSGRIADLGYPPPNVHLRLLVVEDLSTSTIHSLGETFSINPEFFEEHLLNSGYAGADYNMMPSRSWATGSLEKSYFSMRWIRPVFRQPMYSSSRSMKDLVKASTRMTKRVEAVSETGDEDDPEQDNQMGVEHFTPYGAVTTTVSTNIFRSDWPLWTDPGKTANTKRECGLEERLTVWKGTLTGRDCDIIIILSDPLPQVKEDHSASETRDHDTDVSEADTDLAEKGLAQMFYERPPRIVGDTILSMPWDDFRPWKKRSFLKRRPQRPDQAEKESGAGKRARRYMLKRERDTTRSDSGFNRGLTDASSHKVIIKQIVPRDKVAVDLDQVFRSKSTAKLLGHNLTSPKSTSDAICSGLEKNTKQLNLAEPLFQIIKQDTLSLLKQLNHVFDEVETGILDDAMMEDRLSSWRRVIGRAQRELPELRASMKPFFGFIALLDPHGDTTTEANLTNKTEKSQDLREILKEINQAAERLRRTSALLTSNMGLLDSRRSIDEARAVSRLTELAFIFIPLSFATSVFGMQVEPFADHVPLRSFFIVAVVVTAFAYLMRITMRSRWLVYLKIFTRSEIQKYADSHGLPTPTRSIPILLAIRWMGSRPRPAAKRLRRWISRITRKIWGIFGFVVLFVLLNGAVSATPLALIWTRDLDSSTQGAVTIAVILIVVSCVGIPFWHRSDSGFRSALPKWIISTFSMPPWARKIFIFFIFSVVLLSVTLAPIWTSPLASGIKGGVTIIMLVLDILVISFWVQWWSFNGTTFFVS